MKASERHRLKHDAYADTVYKVVAWAKENQTQIFSVLAVALILGVGAVWIIISRQTANAAAQALLAEVEAKTQVSAMQFTFAKEDERDKIVKDAVNACEQLAGDYPGTEAAALGLLQVAKLHAGTGRWPEAASYYRRAMESSGAGTELVALARPGLAAALEADGKYQEAIVEYTHGTDGYSGAQAALVHWNVGRCYQQLHETERAREYYQKILDLAGNSIWADLARTGLAHLDMAPQALVAPPSSAATPSLESATPENIPLIAPSVPKTPGTDEPTAEATEG